MRLYHLLLLISLTRGDDNSQRTGAFAGVDIEGVETDGGKAFVNDALGGEDGEHSGDSKIMEGTGEPRVDSKGEAKAFVPHQEHHQDHHQEYEKNDVEEAANIQAQAFVPHSKQSQSDSSQPHQPPLGFCLSAILGGSQPPSPHYPYNPNPPHLSTPQIPAKNAQLHHHHPGTSPLPPHTPPALLIPCSSCTLTCATSTKSLLPGAVVLSKGESWNVTSDSPVEMLVVELKRDCIGECRMGDDCNSNLLGRWVMDLVGTKQRAVGGLLGGLGWGGVGFWLWKVNPPLLAITGGMVSVTFFGIWGGSVGARALEKIAGGKAEEPQKEADAAAAAGASAF